MLSRHTGNGAVIARCSQPEVGWLGWRSSEDELLISAIADACFFDQGRQPSMENFDEFKSNKSLFNYNNDKQHNPKNVS